MSYRAFKRLLGETSLERKCRYLLGTVSLVLIFCSFWFYARQTEEIAYRQTANSGRLLIPTGRQAVLLHGGRLAGGGPRLPGRLAHSSLPASLTAAVTCSGSSFSRASSSSVISSSRSAPSFMFMILSCSFRMASISISGRGGQPGR